MIYFHAFPNFILGLLVKARLVLLEIFIGDLEF